MEIDLESLLDQKVNSWNISLDMNSENGETSNLNFKSQHLVMNPGQGPSLNCAPGHDSIKDASIIKSYYRRRRVMVFQNPIFDFGPNLGGGKF